MASDISPLQPRPPTDAFHVGYYVVGFLDVLNQRQKLSKWATLPPDESVSPEILLALRESVGVVNSIRDTVMQFVQALINSRPPEQMLNRLAPEQRAEFDLWTRSHLKTQFFADSMVLFAPLAPTGKLVSVKDLVAILMGVGMAVPLLLAAGVAVRGAVQIGTACSAFAGQVYGPCLASAYQLESEVADYPRIVLGQELVNHLDQLCQFPGQEPFQQAVRGMASDARSVVFRDDDGVYAIDYLAEFFYRHSRSADMQGVDELIRKGAAFVDSEYARFVQSGDRKLALRYSRLQRYLRPRVSKWFRSGSSDSSPL